MWAFLRCLPASGGDAESWTGAAPILGRPGSLAVPCQDRQALVLARLMAWPLECGVSQRKASHCPQPQLQSRDSGHAYREAQPL